MIRNYYGIDFHVNKFTYHVIRVLKDGSIKRETATLYLEELETRFIPLLTKDDYICLEALTGSFAFASLLKKHVKDVFVLNPYDLKVITESSKKSDKIDARKLANRLKYYIEAADPEDDFPIVYIPEKHVRELRSLFTTYNLLKKQCVQLKNRIHSILKDNLLVHQKDNLFRHIDYVMIENFEINMTYKIQIRMLYEQLLDIEKRKTEIKEVIIEHGLKYFVDEIKLLIGIKGVSILSACAIMADTADINRFKTANKYTAYMRSAPRLDASNDKVYNGKTDKKGRKLSFSLILQGLTHIKNGNSNFIKFYEVKSNGKSKGKVRSALVRKTFKTIYFMLRNKELYKFYDEKNYNKKLKELEKYQKILKAAS